MAPRCRARKGLRRARCEPASLRQPCMRSAHARWVGTHLLGGLAAVKYSRPPLERTLFSFDSHQELSRWKARRLWALHTPQPSSLTSAVQTFSDAEYGGMSTVSLTLAHSGARGRLFWPHARRS